MGERKCTHVHTHTNTHTHTHRFKLCRKKWTMGKSFGPQMPFPWGGVGVGVGAKQQRRGRKKKIRFYFFSWLYSSAKSLPCRGQKEHETVSWGEPIAKLPAPFQVLGNEVIPLTWQPGRGVIPALPSTLVYPRRLRVKIVEYAWDGLLFISCFLNFVLALEYEIARPSSTNIPFILVRCISRCVCLRAREKVNQRTTSVF